MVHEEVQGRLLTPVGLQGPGPLGAAAAAAAHGDHAVGVAGAPQEPQVHAQEAPSGQHLALKGIFY